MTPSTLRSRSSEFIERHWWFTFVSHTTLSHSDWNLLLNYLFQSPLNYYFQMTTAQNTQSWIFAEFSDYALLIHDHQWFVTLYYLCKFVMNRRFQNLSHNCELNVFWVMAIKHTIMTSNLYPEHNHSHSVSLHSFGYYSLTSWFITQIQSMPIFQLRTMSNDDEWITCQSPEILQPFQTFKKCNYEDGMSRTSENDQFSFLYAPTHSSRNTYWT